MEITQVVDPFSAQLPRSKRGFWVFIIILAIIGGIGYLLYRNDKIRFVDGKLSFNLTA